MSSSTPHTMKMTGKKTLIILHVYIYTALDAIGGVGSGLLMLLTSYALSEQGAVSGMSAFLPPREESSRSRRNTGPASGGFLKKEEEAALHQQEYNTAQEDAAHDHHASSDLLLHVGADAGPSSSASAFFAPRDHGNEKTKHDLAGNVEQSFVQINHGVRDPRRDLDFVNVEKGVEELDKALDKVGSSTEVDVAVTKELLGGGLDLFVTPGDKSPEQWAHEFATIRQTGKELFQNAGEASSAPEEERETSKIKASSPQQSLAALLRSPTCGAYDAETVTPCNCAMANIEGYRKKREELHGKMHEGSMEDYLTYVGGGVYSAHMAVKFLCDRADAYIGMGPGKVPQRVLGLKELIKQRSCKEGSELFAILRAAREQFPDYSESPEMVWLLLDARVAASSLVPVFKAPNQAPPVYWAKYYDDVLSDEKKKQSTVEGVLATLRSLLALPAAETLSTEWKGEWGLTGWISLLGNFLQSKAQGVLTIGRTFLVAFGWFFASLQKDLLEDFVYAVTHSHDPRKFAVSKVAACSYAAAIEAGSPLRLVESRLDYLIIDAVMRYRDIKRIGTGSTKERRPFVIAAMHKLAPAKKAPYAYATLAYRPEPEATKMTELKEFIEVGRQKIDAAKQQQEVAGGKTSPDLLQRAGLAVKGVESAAMDLLLSGGASSTAPESWKQLQDFWNAPAQAIDSARDASVRYLASGLTSYLTHLRPSQKMIKDDPNAAPSPRALEIPQAMDLDYALSSGANFAENIHDLVRKGATEGATEEARKANQQKALDMVKAMVKDLGSQNRSMHRQYWKSNYAETCNEFLYVLYDDLQHMWHWFTHLGAPMEPSGVEGPLFSTSSTSAEESAYDGAKYWARKQMALSVFSALQDLLRFAEEAVYEPGKVGRANKSYNMYSGSDPIWLPLQRAKNEKNFAKSQKADMKRRGVLTADSEEDEDAEDDGQHVPLHDAPPTWPTEFACAEPTYAAKLRKMVDEATATPTARAAPSSPPPAVMPSIGFPLGDDESDAEPPPETDENSGI
ncbi:unnamed protein product [Amoebophrya sp. A25]|nr:unnamed protein product [Amoebophrya sp. A25]|eukprot:GSA25T00022129001.1